MSGRAEAPRCHSCCIHRRARARPAVATGARVNTAASTVLPSLLQLGEHPHSHSNHSCHLSLLRCRCGASARAVRARATACRPCAERHLTTCQTHCGLRGGRALAASRCSRHVATAAAASTVETADAADASAPPPAPAAPSDSDTFETLPPASPPPQKRVSAKDAQRAVIGVSVGDSWSDDDYLVSGTLGKSHGVWGDVVVSVDTSTPEHDFGTAGVRCALFCA